MFEQQPGEVVKVLMAPALIDRLEVRSGVQLEAEVRRADLHRSFVNPKRVRVGSASDEPSATEDAPTGVEPGDEDAGS
jgi:hypothetical protein